MPATVAREITITLPRAEWAAIRDGMLRAAAAYDGPGWCLHAEDDEICADCDERLQVAQQLRDLASTGVTALAGDDVPVDGVAVTLSAFDWVAVVAGLHQAAGDVLGAYGVDCAGGGCADCLSELRLAMEWCEFAERILHLASRARCVCGVSDN